MTWRNRAASIALAAVLVAGCSSTTSSDAAHGASTRPAASPTAAQAAAHGVEAAITAIPWSQVGPGWMLATWSPVPGGPPGAPLPAAAPTREKAITTLYLVDPAGGRYPITTFPPPGDQASPALADWSGDGSHALFEAPYSTPPTAILVDLHAGKQTTLAVHGSPRFTRPDGKALLLSTSPLIDYNLGANTPNVLLGPPLNGGGVIDAVPYAGQQ